MATNIFSSVKKKLYPNSSLPSWAGNVKSAVQDFVQGGQQARNIYSGNTAGNVGTNVSQPKVNTSQYGMSTNKGPVNYNIKPSAPTVKPPPTPPSAPAVADSYSAYLDRTGQAASERAKARYDATVANTNASNELATKGLNEDVASIQDYLKGYTGRVQANADKAKEKAKIESGASQRRLAEANRSNRAQTERQYAALGTVDSYGTGSFTQANENQQSDFNRLTAENEAGLQNKLFSIDSDAADKVAVEEKNFNDTVRQIQRTLAGNTLAQKQAIDTAYMDYQDKVAAIADERDGLKLQAEQEKQKLAAEALSPEFMATGNPKTMNDYMYRVKNAAAYENKLGATLGQGKETDKLVTLIDDISGSNNLGRITGIQGVIPLLPGSKEATTKAQIDQLKSLLSLENRQKLKGQGQISDKEMAILEKSSSILNQNLSEDQFKAALNQLKNELTNAKAESINQPALDLASQYGL